MAEMANVVTTDTIEADWGNDIRDRTLQRYDNISTRDSENAAPTDGDLAFIESTGDVQVYFDGWKGIVPVGAGMLWYAATAPSGYLLCQGQAVSRTTYAALFAVMSTTYGVGDGSTTFNLPDLRQRFPLGKAASGTGDDLAETGGAINHTHTGPSHTHNVDIAPFNSGDAVADADTFSQGLYQGQGVRDEHHHSINPPTTATGSGGTGNTGASNPPFIVVNFIVKV